jgi:RNA polymerase sigma factor (sigma-70 family)
MAIVLPFARPTVEPMSSARSVTVDPTGAARDEEQRWRAWMLAAQDGDRAAYRALLQAITPYLRGIARHYLGTGEDTEDAVQDILLTVHHIRHTYELGRPFKPWLYTIAARRCIDLLRRRAFRLQHEIGSKHAIDELASARDTPEELTSRLHEARTVRAAVARLPLRQREAIQVLRLRELSMTEAAEQSHQSVGALKVACHRALKSLRRILEPRDQPHD